MRCLLPCLVFARRSHTLSMLPPSKLQSVVTPRLKSKNGFLIIGVLTLFGLCSKVIYAKYAPVAQTPLRFTPQG